MRHKRSQEMPAIEFRKNGEPIHSSIAQADDLIAQSHTGNKLDFRPPDDKVRTEGERPERRIKRRTTMDIDPSQSRQADTAAMDDEKLPVARLYSRRRAAHEKREQ